MSHLIEIPFIPVTLSYFHCLFTFLFYLNFELLINIYHEQASTLSGGKKTGHKINTLIAKYEYSRSKKDNLPLPVQMPLSEKLKTFSALFIALLRSALNF